MDKHLFMSAFETFKEELEICKEAILDIVQEKVELTCLACGHVFMPEGLDYSACQKCGGAVRMSKGTEMKLLSLEML